MVARHARETAVDGGSVSDCPLAPSDPLWPAWQKEWARTRRNMESADGTMLRRTQEMRAEVQRQTQHLPYLQPDPCAEVLESQPVLHGWQQKPPALWAPRRSGARDHREVVQALEQMTAALTAGMESTLRRVDEWLSQSLRPEVMSSPQRRHGSAARCPRHGETRGGTCMKCARRR